MRKNIIIGLLAAIAIVSCDDPNEGSLFVQPTTLESEMSMTTFMEESPEIYSEWIDLLKYTDYYNALKNANASATVFAPTNDAINEYLSSRGLESVRDMDYDYARKLVQNHIIDWGSASSSLSDSIIISLATSKSSLPAQNLFNKYLTLCYGYENTDVDDAERTGELLNTDTIYINNQARLGRFVSSNCSNGDIYRMSDVIIPNAENIVEKLHSLSGTDNTYELFANAIEADEEVYNMATLERDTVIGDGGVRVVNNYSYTCFAVPDHVMAAAGITDVQSLKNYLVSHSDGEETDGDVALNHYLLYHFMPTQYTMDEVFRQTDSTEVLIYDTKYTGQAFTCQYDDNGTRILNDGIEVLRSDIEASNGLITKVSEVMPVYHPDPVNVKWDFLNSADIISFVNAYSADKALGSIFTSALESNARQIDLSDEYYDGQWGTITAFTCKYNESSCPSRTARRVGFVKEGWQTLPTRDVTQPQHAAYMNNYLVLNLGYAGWVEFTTPTIIAGKYKIVLHYIKDPQISQLYTSGTLTQFNIDGDDNQTLAYLYRGQKNTPISVMYNSTDCTEDLWTTFEFDGSSTHTFRLTTRDMQAKNESYYRLMLDYLEFIPIE